MHLRCIHCNETWELPSAFSKAALVCFQRCRSGIKASEVRVLRNELGLDMMRCKSLLQHLSSKDNRCFCCSTTFPDTQGAWAKCMDCGAVNILPERGA